MDFSEVQTWRGHIVIRCWIWLFVAIVTLSGCKDEGGEVRQENKNSQESKGSKVIESLLPGGQAASGLTLVAGRPATLEMIVVLPGGARSVANVDELMFTSLNPSVAMVDTKGNVTALSAGEAIIRITHKKTGITTDIKVTVQHDSNEVKSVLPGGQATLNLTLVAGRSVTPEMRVALWGGANVNANVDDLVFTSLNTAVAIVDARGNITAVSAGEATIRVMHKRVGVTADIKVSVIAERIETFKNVQDVQFETVMTLPAAEIIQGVVGESSSLAMTDIVYVDDILFEGQGSEWFLSNKTHLPVGEIAVTYQGAAHPAVLQLDQEIPSYTRAKLFLSTEVVSGLKYVNQKIMFHPRIRLGGETACSNPAATCYNSPRIGGERANYERVLGYIHEVFNRPSFVDGVTSFFKKSCSSYPGCKEYGEAYPDDLGYAYRHYLTMGQEGHALAMRVMRNRYAAEGMGGGSGPDLAKYLATSGGWASIWANYVDEKHPSYRVLDMNTLFHEIAHAYGYNHDSGWSYGVAEYLADSYFPSLGLDPRKKPTLNSAELIASYQLVDGALRITLKAKAGRKNASKIKMRIASNKKTSFVTKYLDSPAKNTVEVKFDSLPVNPVYLQMWDDEAIYMTTLKFDDYMLAKSNIYEVTGMRFTVMPPELIDKKAGGWAIRDRCIRPGNNMKLATKSQYETLYNYLKGNGKLNELPFREYLTSDEPAGYRIWNVTFGADRMEASHHWMRESIGDQRGLICVEELR